MSQSVTDSLGQSRRATLEAIRYRLARILDGAAGHTPGCECECGAPFDAKAVAPIARELREVLAQLDDLPEQGGGSEVASIAAQRAKRRAEAARNATEGE